MGRNKNRKVRELKTIVLEVQKKLYSHSIVAGGFELMS